jgi:hypothetical protein
MFAEPESSRVVSLAVTLTTSVAAPAERWKSIFSSAPAVRTMLEWLSVRKPATLVVTM